MCVNDIVVQGAEPLFFLDYYATGKLDVDTAAVVMEGIARACKESGCALIGGETAEMPGLYAKGDFDLAGFAVGAVERAAILPKTGAMQRGRCADRRRLVSGVHSNGFSLVRKVVEKSRACAGRARAFRARQEPGRGAADADAALCAERAGGDAHRRREGPGPYHRRRHHRQSAALPARRAGCGSGSGRHGRRCRCSAGWRRQAGIAESEMLRTFNCGIGLVAVADEKHAGHVIDAFQEAGDKALRASARWCRGDGEAKVVYRGALKL